MKQTTKASEIGLRQAARLCNMPSEKQLEFIAEGLPYILESARSLMKASHTLVDFPREARILEGHAEEECAKILILIDIIRCPKKLVASRMGPMMKWFYNHLARLIYSEAQTWKPISVLGLQAYVNNDRDSHYLEGEYSEYIMPNWKLFLRESSLYVDVVGGEDTDLAWSSPLEIWNSPIDEAIQKFSRFEPASYRVVNALGAFGAFTVSGVKILREVWGKVDFQGEKNWIISRELCTEMIEKLHLAKLITEQPTDDHTHALYNSWQIPMYRIDFSELSITLEDLRKRREMHLPYGI